MVSIPINPSIVFFLAMFFSSTNVLKAETLSVAVRAHKGVDKAVEQWQPTLTALEHLLKGQSFLLVPVVSLDELSQRASQSAFDFVLTNPSSYVELEQLHGAKAIATLINKRANKALSRFGSVIFTHASNTKIISLQDLEQKTLMVVSKPAFGGWRVAWLEMLEQGFDPHKKLKKLLFAEGRTQPEVVQAVLEKTVDAGVVRTDLLERLEASGEIDMRYLRILNNKDIKEYPFFLSSKLYPEWAFAAMKHVPVELADKIANALQSITRKNPAALAGKYVGWKSPANYHTVNLLMQRLKVGPYEK